MILKRLILTRLTIMKLTVTKNMGDLPLQKRASAAKHKIIKTFILSNLADLVTTN